VSVIVFDHRHLQRSTLCVQILDEHQFHIWLGVDVSFQNKILLVPLRVDSLGSQYCPKLKKKWHDTIYPPNESVHKR
jgi:hypothetical protein